MACDILCKKCKSGISDQQFISSTISPSMRNQRASVYPLDGTDSLIWLVFVNEMAQ